ncbi:hypothetical protein [Amylibacter sp. IMCC11727]|uniref:hypothetical protein n=1 Tax=Amylibacter sp. IMCC11727 TaxID=3039851 RepID=UPI00244E0219|nr:hypothetical protein [Amylibacter sp. IMCC11727]WGI22626.1 hypothetical protein QBD29_04205 [Amylibacter sp. IMCC11727]
MAVYLTPESVAARLSEQVTEAQRLLGLSVRKASDFQFQALFTDEELQAFGVTQGPSVFLIVEDGPAFEELIPERQNGMMNYMQLKHEKALARIDPFFKPSETAK